MTLFEQDIGTATKDGHGPTKTQGMQHTKALLFATNSFVTEQRDALKRMPSLVKKAT